LIANPPITIAISFQAGIASARNRLDAAMPKTGTSVVGWASFICPTRKPINSVLDSLFQYQTPAPANLPKQKCHGGRTNAGVLYPNIG
jgi:hypothetical protein